MGDQPHLVRQWPADEIRTNRVRLPPLRRSKHYRLQGTLHTCAPKDSKVCALESRDVDLQAVKKSKKRSFEIVLSKP
jgi:hypothetical protein